MSSDSNHPNDAGSNGENLPPAVRRYLATIGARGGRRMTEKQLARNRKAARQRAVDARQRRQV